MALGIDDDKIDVDKVNLCLKKSNLWELVSQLPNGIDEFIGEKGSRLSGGQRQRLSIARAFYFDKQIMILDEATSALDSNMEAEIVSEIEKLKGHVTMIIIAHRLSTLRYCDKVYEISNGEIISSGTYHEMISQKGMNV